MALILKRKTGLRRIWIEIDFKIQLLNTNIWSQEEDNRQVIPEQRRSSIYIEILSRCPTVHVTCMHVICLYFFFLSFFLGLQAENSKSGRSGYSWHGCVLLFSPQTLIVSTSFQVLILPKTMQKLCSLLAKIRLQKWFLIIGVWQYLRTYYAKFKCDSSRGISVFRWQIC